tara:strand:+ start:269 stop:793 length:525 start_codon:yes stop_codon:yes gene_type:complete
MLNYSKQVLIILIFTLIFNSCGNKFGDARKTPTNALERARKNVEEGKGASIGGLLGNRGGTNYEFSSSNPMWRASLEILDFLPLNTVDYSGGMIISDWYSDNSNNESVKITIRFLSNEVRSDSLKVIVHKKNCSSNQDCKIILMDNTTLVNELRSSIVRKAAVLEKENKKKKKK